MNKYFMNAISGNVCFFHIGIVFNLLVLLGYKHNVQLEYEIINSINFITSSDFA